MRRIDPKESPFSLSNANDSMFAESENFIAIYNLAPILPGHSLIVPKRYVVSLMELTEKELCEMMAFSRRVVQVLLEIFKADGFNWTIQDGEEAGQTVPHLHLHLIPRKEGDLPHPGDWYPKLKKSETELIDSAERPQLNSEELKRIAGHIKKYMGDLKPFSS
jgi:bis(5'-adenosyl)-triphosphatase